MTNPESNSPTLFLEFAQSSATITFENKTSTVELEHEASGGLTKAAKDALKNSVTKALRGKRPSATYCAISARGVSLRKMQLPPSKPENLRQMLSFQIEKEFPLDPDELAWGFQNTHPTTDDSQPQDILLVAVKKEGIESYASMLSEVGITPIFTVGILSSAAHLADTTTEPFVLLNVGTSQTEFVLCENGIPSTIRTIPLGISSDLAALGERLKRGALPDRVFLAGELIGDSERMQLLEEALGKTLHTSTAATAISSFSKDRTADLLTLQIGGGEVATSAQVQPFPVKWAAIAAALLLGMIVMRYVEPMVKKSALEAKITEVNAAREALPPIEEELDFLRYLESNRPAYINAITVLSDSIPRGTQFSALSLNGRGEFSFRATIKTPQEAHELRSKLLESGLFSSVVIPDQTASRNPRGLIIRVTARWNPDPKAPSKTIDRIVAESEASSTNAPSVNIEG